MKSGDTGWVRVTVAEAFNDGTFFVNANGFHEDDDMIPDHPALPTVARWLEDMGTGDVAEIARLAELMMTEGGTIEYDDAGYGEWLLDHVRALIAALTEGQG